MVTGSVKHYLELNRKYLIEGETLLMKGDPVQACEKFWGAAAEIVKAVSASTGLELRTHADLWAFVTKLREEVKEPEITKIFGLAGMLHQNFYEASMTLEAVRDHAEAIKQFVTKLRKLLTRP